MKRAFTRVIAVLSTLLDPAVRPAQHLLVPKTETLPAVLLAKTRNLNPAYLVNRPDDIKEPAHLPLAIYLHGGGGVGNDVHRVRGKLTPNVESIATTGKEAIIVVAPQCLRKT